LQWTRRNLIFKKLLLEAFVVVNQLQLGKLLATLVMQVACRVLSSNSPSHQKFFLSI